MIKIKNGMVKKIQKLIELIQDENRQCLVTKENLAKIILKDRVDFDDIDDLFNDIDVKSGETNDYQDALLISLGVCFFLMIVIGLLCFCLFSKRDLAPCPQNSNFGRRYSVVRQNSRAWAKYGNNNIPFLVN